MKQLQFGFRDSARRFMCQIVMIGLVMMVVGSSLGCQAVVWPLEISKTVEGLNQAAHGVAGTFAYLKETSPIVVLGWPQGDGKYSFMLMDKAGEMVKLAELCNANCVKWDTAAKFLNWLEANGWQNVPAGLLPPALVSAISQTAFVASMAVSAASRGSTSVFTIPAVILDTNPFEFINPQIGS